MYHALGRCVQERHVFRTAELETEVEQDAEVDFLPTWNRRFHTIIVLT